MPRRSGDKAMSFLSNRLAKDTLTMSVGNVLRLFLQAVYFIAIARTLGSRQYGEFVAILAVIGVITPFAGLGSPSILLRSVSQDRGLLRTYWGNGLILIASTGSLFTGALCIFASLILGKESLLCMICLSISELLLSRVVELASFAFTALGKMRDTALLNIYISLSRLLCILCLAAIKTKPTLEDWCIAVLCGTSVCAAYSLWRIQRLEGAGLDLDILKRELSQSAFFAIGNSAATFYNDVDKSMLARLSSASAAGTYGAAYKIIDVSMAPIRAMTASSYAEFFRRGAAGPAHAMDYAKQLIKKSALFGIAIFVALMLAAPALPLVLGRTFEDSIEALRWLALIPLMRSIHLFLGDVLSGCGLNGSRTLVQVVVAVVNIGMNFILIRRWSWRGAAWSSLLCDALLLIGFGLAFWVATGRIAVTEDNPVKKATVEAAAAFPSA